MPARRHFGSVRRLPSGRYQASYWHLAERHVAPETFTTKGEAYEWLSTVEADVLKGAWVAPSAGAQTFGDYAGDWLSRRRDLRPRTRELYEYLLGSFLLPAFRNVCLADLTLARIRLWHGGLVTEHPALAPKAYRLLKTILNTAVEDRRLVANPCQIKGAAAEHPDERPVATVAEVEALAETVPPRYRAMVLLAAWCSLRFGELAALTRQRVNPIQGWVEVQQTLTETDDGRLRLGPPKTKAGRRTVAIPPHVMPDLMRHLETYVGPTPDSLLFPAPEGTGYLRRSNFARRIWRPATRKVGVSLHFHDLRHSGLTWTAATGATLAELMRRAGHATPRAALIYQHATEDRDRVLADALSELHRRAEGIRLDKHRDSSGSAEVG
jgi:integrase